MSPNALPGMDPDLQLLLSRSDMVFEETRRLLQSGKLSPEEIHYLDRATEELIAESEAILSKLKSRQ